jgi:hypothetical protein
MNFKCKKRMVTWIFLLLATFAAGQSNTATVPRLVRFSGVAKDETGQPKTGVLGVTFALYKEKEGGSPLWLEVQNVQADSNGRYSALLGSTKPDGIPAELFSSNQARWLGVQPEGQSEQPRVLFVSVPYALKAADAETIGGLPPSAFVRANPETSASTSNEQRPPSSREITASSAVVPLTNLSVITPSPGQTPGFVPLWTGTSPTRTLGSSALFQLGTNAIGVNTKAPGASLEIDSPNQLGLFVNAPFTGVGAGIDLHTTGTGGKGWEILNTGKTSAQGASKLNIRDLSSGADVFTIAPNGLVGIGDTNPGTVLQVTDNNVVCCAVGTVLAADAFKTGTAIFADVTRSAGLSEGVFSQVFSTTNSSSALLGEAHGTTGRTNGVQGFNFSNTDFSDGVSAVSIASGGKTAGLIGTSTSPNGTGVIGFGQGQSSVGSGIGCCVVGIWGDTSATTPGAAGLVGTADDARAIYLENNSPSGVPTAFMRQDASGQFALVAGGFGDNVCTIDTTGHIACKTPSATVASVGGGQRHIELYSMESPQNWSEDFGSARLSSGATAVTLDPVFAETVNPGAEYHVFLTPAGDCRGLYISNKTADGFEVRELGGGQSNVAFDYRIVALRRGFENVRMQDVTERWTKVSAQQPKPASGSRFTLPATIPAPAVSPKSPVATQAKLSD